MSHFHSVDICVFYSNFKRKLSMIKRQFALNSGTGTCTTVLYSKFVWTKFYSALTWKSFQMKRKTLSLAVRKFKSGKFKLYSDFSENILQSLCRPTLALCTLHTNVRTYTVYGFVFADIFVLNAFHTNNNPIQSNRNGYSS